MAAKAWGTQPKAVDEVVFQNDSVSLCFLINRRAKTMRILDFRAGASSAKRMFVLSLAKREGVEKAYTLVERDEATTWAKLGFVKEGTIPGFYKRTDAFLLGCGVPKGAAAKLARVPVIDDEDDTPTKSGMRLVTADPVAPVSAAQEQMERTLIAAKKTLKEDGDRGVPSAKIAEVSEADARKAVALALKNRRALTGFEAFGRDAERRYFAVTAKGGFELVASIESQACFGNAFLELLQGPRSDADRNATAGALRAFGDRLLSEGVVSVFSLAPSDDAALAVAYLSSGFRRTGLLVDHLVVDGERKDAIVWSRKLATGGDD